MAQYPVCRMNVEESTAAATSTYKNKTYYFCAVGCKKDFEKILKSMFKRPRVMSTAVTKACRFSET